MASVQSLHQAVEKRMPSKRGAVARVKPGFHTGYGAAAPGVEGDDQSCCIEDGDVVRRESNEMATIGRYFLTTVCAVLITTSVARATEVASAQVTVYSNLVFVPVQLDRAEKFDFMLDSGLESTSLDQALAQRLKFAQQSVVTATAPGGSIEVGATRKLNARFASGFAFVRDGSLQTIPLSGLEPVLGRTLSGIIGYDIFRRFVIEIDYAGKQVVLYDPATFAMPQGFQVLPMQTEQDEMFIQGVFEQPGHSPIAAKLKVDTGSASGLGLNGSFVQEAVLFPPEAPRLRLRGIALGGATDNFAARVERFKFGGVQFTRPIVTYSADKTRVGDAGTVGGDILSRFTIIFDEPHRRLLAKPNAHFLDPLTFDESGMTIIASTPGGVTVAGVDTGSAAERAGVQTGDSLTAVDLHPVADWSLASLRDRFCRSGPVGLALLRQGRQIRA